MRLSSAGGLHINCSAAVGLMNESMLLLVSKCAIIADYVICNEHEEVQQQCHSNIIRLLSRLAPAPSKPTTVGYPSTCAVNMSHLRVSLPLTR